MKKIYIAGCGGMLGEAFHALFGQKFLVKCSDIDVNEDWLTYCDMRDIKAYLDDVQTFKPDYLFHLGAFTDLEYCEVNADDTYRTNALSVENAVYIANKLDIPLLYIGTAGIFDGTQDHYDDWSIPNPLGVYARAKWAGELFVRENCPRHFVCRAGWMMGGGPKKDKKFVQKLMKQIKEGKKELHVVNDKLGTPTYTHDFAANVLSLLKSELWGLYNMASEGATSRLEVARELVLNLHLEKEITITEVTSDFFEKDYFAQRPASERLVNKKLSLRGLNTMRNWKDALREYLSNDYADYL